ncbi:MAG: SLC13 family permease [Caldilineales bacterium]|nr:SLC13 family permease [Caldilineales bacterium]
MPHDPCPMTLDIALTLAILLAVILLFVTERLRPDLVGLFVLVILVIAGLVTPTESIAGFSNPAVVTIWAVFILSAGLARTGVAAKLGEQVIRLARARPNQSRGSDEARLLTVLMTSTALLSGFMNNIGVAAMFLPVTIDIARRTGRAASRLLLPMAYASLLGGMLMLIGTASNLVISDFLRDVGLPPLGLFDFTPIGLAILVVSILYMNLIGRRLLPDRQTPRPLAAANSGMADRDLRTLYGLEERLAMLILPEDSPLAGRTLTDSRVGRALGLNILSIERKNGLRLAPDPTLILEGGDRLLALGRLDQFEQISNRPLFHLENDRPALQHLLAADAELAEFEIAPGSAFAGKTLVEVGVRQRFGASVLAMRRGDRVRRTNLQQLVLEPGDRVLIEGLPVHLRAFADQPGFRTLSLEEAEAYNLEKYLLVVSVPEGSALGGRTIQEARLGAAYGISVLNVIRQGRDWFLPDASLTLQAGDQLLLSGHTTDIEVLRGLQTIKLQPNVHIDLTELEDGPFAIIEVMLSPYTTLAGKTLRQLRFREKFGVSVLAIWRGDRAYRTGLADIPLQYGDAFLCYGSRERFEILARERDFFVLKLDVQEKPRLEKAPFAALIMLGVVAVVLLGWLPISVAAIAGAALMVLTRCLSMDEAYRAISWQAVFLIASMLPLGLAMQQTGAAALLANSVVNLVGPYGPVAILAGIMILTLAVNQFIPSAVNAVVMSPIALATAANLGVSPYPFMMGIAYAIASSFMTPVSHPANVLVMSPGGYRFSDYVKNGFAISLIVLLVGIPLLPIFFPF